MVGNIAVRLVVAVLLLGVIEGQTTYFCSTFCRQTGCNGWTSNDCNNQCNTGWGWVAQSGPCWLSTTSGKDFIDSSDDAGGSISVSPISTTPNCLNFSGTSLQTYGAYKANQAITLTLFGGTTLPHWGVDLMYGMILIDTDGGDNWNGNPQIFNTLVGSVPVQAPPTPLSGSSIVASSKVYCGASNKWDSYIQVKQTYTHNSSNTDISFTLTINHNKPNALFVIKEVIMVAKLCNIACLSCFGSAITQCTSCDPAIPYLLNNLTCALTCTAGYGYTDDPAMCVWCNLKCASSACYGLFDNCTACRSSGTWASYLYYNDSLGYSTCINPCPDGYYANSTSRTCQLCDPNCTECSTRSTYCQACVVGYGWYNFLCYQPCNSGFYYTNNNTNCTKCNLTCLECMNLTVCTICTTTGPNTAYLLGTICYKICPAGSYGDTSGGSGPNLCLPCDPLCPTCTGSPSPCLSCITGYYLYGGVCGSTCPTGYTPYAPLSMCMDCNTFCIGVDIKIYHPSAVSEQVYIDMTFSKPLNYSTFDHLNFQTVDVANHAMGEFTLTYDIISSTVYRIILKPIGFIFLYNETVSVNTRDLGLSLDTGQSDIPFKPSNYAKSASLNWFLLKAPDMSDMEKQVINVMSTTSGILAKATTSPILAQIKKAGIMAMLFSGAQITTCSIFVNSVPAQNMYEGVRFWGIFVFYDVPEWQRNSAIPNHVFGPDVHDLVKDERRLFDMTTLYWRFHRTGQSSFFIYDVYIPMLLIAICWTLALIAYCLRDSYSFKTYEAKFFTVVHKIHEASILYVTMGMLMQWIYFDAGSFERWVSLIVCVFFNVYFVAYELYIYYDLIKYPEAQIGNERYEYYLSRYGCFLKNMRYDQYDVNEEWSWRHWFRPYNYHLLSYYKKFCMIISLPIFYDVKYFQASVLILLQIMEVSRLLATQPYYARWRNVYRLFLEIFLLMFFAVVMAETFLIAEISLNDPNTLLATVNLFYNLGWLGFVLVFAFNIGFIVLFVVDVVNGFRHTTREMMDEARRVYYYNKIGEYEKENEQVPLGLMNRWVKLGNLNKRNAEELPDINLRVELYRLVRHTEYFDVEIHKVVSLFMNTDFNFHKENNTTVGEKIRKKTKLSKQLSPSLYGLMCEVFSKHAKKDTDALVIKTFTHICQKDFKAGDKVPLIPAAMFQKLQLQNFMGEKENVKLKQMIRGFPLNPHDLQSI